MMINERPDVYYDKISNSINFLEIEKHLNQLKNLLYSSHLISTIERMLCPTVTNRPDFSQSLDMVTHLSHIPIDNTARV